MNDLFQPDPIVDQDKDYLAELVGEGKKFKDTQALARGKAESDNFITTLQSQMDALRQDYLRLDTESKKRASIEELINRNQQPESHEPPVITTPPAKQPEVNLDELVDTRLRRHEQQKIEESNLSQTRAMLRERFGTDYLTKLRETVSQMGLTDQDANILARKSPEALYRLLALEQTPEPFQTPPRQTSLVSRKAEPKRTWSYYMKMKQERPSEYHSAKTNVQMHKDSQELGESFFDTD